MKLNSSLSTECYAARLLKVTADSLAPPDSLFGKLKAIRNLPRNSVEWKLMKDIQNGGKDIQTRDRKFIVSIKAVGSTGRYHGTVTSVRDEGIMSRRVDASAERKVYAREVRKQLGLEEQKINEPLDSNKRVNLESASLSERDLSGISLALCNLRNANLENSSLEGADLRYADLARARISGVSFRHADLSGAKLQEVDLRGALLEGATLTDSNLSGKDLSRCNLSYTNLQGKDLRGANLMNAYLHDANLSNADLNGVNLRDACLEGVKLAGVDLRNVDLSSSMRRVDTHLKHIDLCWLDVKMQHLHGINLRNTDLRSANLSGHDLSRCDMGGADLSNADLSDVSLKASNLKMAILSGTNLSGTDLSNARLKSAMLTDVNLGNANLGGADFNNASLNNVDLSGLNLSLVNLERASLRKVNLRESDLRETYLRGATLNGCDLTNAKLCLVPEGVQWDDEELDIQLNHHNNPGGSLLSTLSSIDDRFADIKITQARIIMDSLKSQDIQPTRLTSVALPLLEVLGRQPYSSDPALATWLADIAAARFDAHGSEGMTPEIAGFCLSIFENAPDKMLQQNADFHQLIHTALSGNPASISRAGDAYATYLTLPEIAPYTKFAFYDRTNSDNPDSPAQVSLQNTDEVNLVLWPATTGGPVMLLSRDTYQGMQWPDPLNPVWDHFFLMNTPEACVSTADVAPEALFRKDFPQFLEGFLSEQRKASFGKLLDTLNLGDYRKKFVNATEKHSAATKMVDPKAQTDLNALFSHTLQPGTDWSKLADAHVQEIVQAYGLGNVTKREQAQYFLCLSAMFARFSSSHFFGTENDSPVTLRVYAHALMLKSQELDDSVPGVQFTDWQNRFLKRAKAFDCTAVLSDSMTKYLKRTCPQVLAAIRPPAWA